jgi:TadE-like protein
MNNKVSNVKDRYKRSEHGVMFYPNQDGADWKHSRGDETRRILALTYRRLDSTKGQTMVEFAIVATMFFFLIFALLDFGRLFFVQMNLQEAVQEAARYASTGNHLPNPNNPGQTLSRVQSITTEAEQAAFGWGANVTNIKISSLNGGVGSAGGPGDVVTVSLTVSLKLLTPIVAAGFPNGMYTFISSSTVKNEPFSAANTN